MPRQIIHHQCGHVWAYSLGLGSDMPLDQRRFHMARYRKLAPLPCPTCNTDPTLTSRYTGAIEDTTERDAAFKAAVERGDPGIIICRRRPAGEAEEEWTGGGSEDEGEGEKE